MQIIDANLLPHVATTATKDKPNSIISMLKNLGASNTHPKTPTTPNNPNRNPSIVISSQNTQNKQQSETKEFPTTSPLESLIKTMKPNPNSKVNVSAASEDVENKINKLELTSKPYTVVSEEDYMEHKESIVHLKHSPDGRNIVSIDIKGTIKSNLVMTLQRTIFYFNNN